MVNHTKTLNAYRDLQQKKDLAVGEIMCYRACGLSKFLKLVQYKMKKIYFLLVAFLFFPVVCAGDEVPYPMAGNEHIKLLNYNPIAIHRYTGYYGYQSSIIFEPGETIDVVSMGDSSGWQFVPKGNRLFLKPISDNAETNATIITNKRVYQFEFHADDASGLEDPKLAYEVRFVYPSGSAQGPFKQGVIDVGAQEIPDPSSEDIAKKGLNFDYSIAHFAGSNSILPIKVFDDGRFTYVQFRKLGSQIPSFFSVDAEGYESIVNFHVSGDYVVIESVEPLFTLRYGARTACLFNEDLIGEYLN